MNRLLGVGNRLTLRARLVLALLVPVLGMTFFTAMWALQRLDDSRRAGEAREQAQILVAGMRLYNAVSFAHAIPALVLEGGGSSTLGDFRSITIGQISASQRDIAAKTEALRTMKARDADHRDAIVRIVAVTDELLDGPAGRSGGRVDEALSAQALRDLDRARDDLGLELNRLRVSGDATQAAETAVLLSLADLRTVALREGSLLVLNAQRRGSNTATELREVATATRVGIRLAANQLPIDLRDQLLRFDDTADGRRFEDLRDQVYRGEPMPFLGFLVALQRRIDLFAGLQDRSGERVLERVSIVERDARRAFLVAVWVAAGVVLLSMILGFLALRPTTRTLRRLAGQARRIGSGDLNVAPLAVDGRDEAAVLAGAFDEMSRTLRTLQFQLDALADGRGEDPVLGERVPGHIGEAMARSLAHVRAMTSRLRSSEEAARLTIDTAIEAIWTLGPNGEITSANAASASLLGMPVFEMIGRHLEDVVGADWLVRDHDGSITTVTDHEVTLRQADQVNQLLMSTRRVAAADGSMRIMLFARDISERKRLEERLAWEAAHDSLTGLPNRVALLRHLTQAAGRAQLAELAVMFVDLDRFKRVNDGLGHRVGDDLLRQVADRLRVHLREEDLLARLGGDEFVVVRTGVATDDELEAIARRLVDAIERPFEVEGTVAHISASIGIVAVKGPADAADLIRRADVAMYHAKQSGRGRVVRYDESMHGTVRERIDLEEALRVALANDELEPAFQPIMSVVDGHLGGVELLARWDRPGRGPVSPGAFIPVAEDTGLVIEIGRWALREAAAAAVRLRATTPRFGVAIAVNISGVHLVHGDLVSDVREVLETSGARPEWLRIEITESYLLEESLDAVDDDLRTLVGMGITLSVDDFGTGYSSLTYLRRIPADVVKIDRSYVARLEHDPSELAIIGLVASLAHSLGMRVVAEGVESEVQRALLEGAGCEYGQGFLFAAPMSAEAFSSWVAQRVVDPPADASPWTLVERS